MDGVGRNARRTMSRNVIVDTFGTFMKEHKFSKKNGSWYRASADMITVVELQKSQYGHQYYVNLALWIMSLGEDSTPKEQNCHVRTRLGSIVGEKGKQVSDLFNLDTSEEDNHRSEALKVLLSETFLPILDTLQNSNNLYTPLGRRILKNSLVNRQAQEYLETNAN